MTPTYADMDLLRAALVAGQCETALHILDTIVAAEEPEPPASFKQNRFLSLILTEPIATVKGWCLTLTDAKSNISALLNDESVTIAGTLYGMSQTFRDKQTRKSAIPW